MRNLAVLRYIFEAIPTTDSWHLVFERHIRQLSGQIEGLGVDPSQVPASPDDPGLPSGGKPWPGGGWLLWIILLILLAFAVGIVIGYFI